MEETHCSYPGIDVEGLRGSAPRDLGDRDPVAGLGILGRALARTVPTKGPEQWLHLHK